MTVLYAFARDIAIDRDWVQNLARYRSTYTLNLDDRSRTGLHVRWEVEGVRVVYV